MTTTQLLILMLPGLLTLGALVYKLIKDLELHKSSAEIKADVGNVVGQVAKLVAGIPTMPVATEPTAPAKLAVVPPATPPEPALLPPAPPPKAAGFGRLEVMICLVGLAALGIDVGACCHFSGSCKNTPAMQVVVDCSKVAYQTVLQEVTQVLESGVAPDGGDWLKWLEQLGVKVGENTVECAVDHAINPASQPAVSNPAELDRIHEYLAEHPNDKLEN